MTDSIIAKDEAIGKTRLWLERAVLGLKLCPFARFPYETGRVRFAVIDAFDEAGRRDGFIAEVQHLRNTPADVLETTLVIYPNGVADFIEFLEFVKRAQSVLGKRGLDERFQIAPFHPLFQFNDQPAEAIENYSNRSPLPILQLLRQRSVEHAVASVGAANVIYEQNIQTLQALGLAGWARIW